MADNGDGGRLTDQDVQESRLFRDLQGGASMPDSTPNEEHEEAASKAERAIRLVENEAVLFHDQFREGYVSVVVPNDPSRQCLKILSQEFTSWLTWKFWISFTEAIGPHAVTSASRFLDAKAIYEGPTYPLHNRVAWCRDCLYYDLGPGLGAVKVEPGHWATTKDLPVLFRRFRHQAQQVQPTTDGDAKAILEFVRLRTGGPGTLSLQQVLFLLWLLTGFIPDIPRPIGLFRGDQGSAKSTAKRIVRRIVDPSCTELLSAPSDVAEFIQVASHHYALFLDNVSHVSQWLNDCLSRAVTGEGFSKRRLYTDDEDILYSYKRFCALGGISITGLGADLLDRCALFDLERIPDDERRPEGEFFSAFERARPGILGGMFNILCRVLETRNSAHIPNRLPRMADWGRWCHLLGPLLGVSREVIDSAIGLNARAQTATAIDQSAVVEIFLDFLESEAPGGGEWQPSDLYSLLKDRAASAQVLHGFPKAANALWPVLKKGRVTLLEMGWNVERIDLRPRRIRATPVRQQAPDPKEDCDTF